MMNKKQLNNYIKLEEYESLKDLFINFWGVDNKRIKKVLNKTPKAFIKYILKHYEIKATWQVIITDAESEFIASRETEEEAKKLFNKWVAICENAKVELKQIEYLKLK